MPETFSTSNPLRFITLLSPHLYQTYESIVRYVGEYTGLPTTLSTGRSVADLEQGQGELGFLCGLLYVRRTELSHCPVEPLAAPVLRGERYGNRPVYFSDVIVRRESAYGTLADLRGCVWAYNERASHSGYNLVEYSLWQRGIRGSYFGRFLETGAHMHSLQAVLEGRADAAAIDSHLLDVLFQSEPTLKRQLRVVEMFGPSSIPPLVVSKCLEPALKRSIREALLTMHHDALFACELAKGEIEHFVPVTDASYNDIREMFSQVSALAC